MLRQNRLPWIPLFVLSIACAIVLVQAVIPQFPQSSMGNLQSVAAQVNPALTVGYFDQAPLSYFDFKGRFLAVLSDADMVASAYIDNQLGKRSPNMTDTLTLISLKQGIAGLSPVTLPVSNSVMAWPNNLAFTPDGRFAFVTETFAPAPLGATRRSDIPSGRLLSAIDLNNPQQPRIIERRNLGNEPRAVTVHPDGNLLAVSLREPERQIALIPFLNGKLGTPTFHRLPDIENPNANAAHLEWHPSGRFLGVTIADRNEAVFYEIDRSNPQQPQIRSWGNPIMTGKALGVGHFTPDGRYFITTNLLWGDDVESQYVGTQSSYLTAIRFADRSNANNQVRHQIVSTASVGGSAEEFAISSNGQFVVSLNMEASFLPWNDERLTRYSSLTLLSFNPETGRLTPHNTTQFEGILPEGITFDGSGNYLAVANFDRFNPTREGTTLDFWRVIPDRVPTLVKMDISIPLMRGAHIVKVVP